MASVGMRVDLSTLIDAAVAGDAQQIAVAARALVQENADIDVLLGRVGMIAARGDQDGDAVVTLNAASTLSRWLYAFTHIVEAHEFDRQRAIPILVQAIVASSSAIRAGRNAQITYPQPYFPSDLPEGQSMSDQIQAAVHQNDTQMVERLLLGLYGTGADYRTMQARAYNGIATTFDDNGHALIDAVRGYQLLDPVEWGENAPYILHWLAPHLPIQGEEPAWIQPVRAFVDAPEHSLARLRTRLSTPKESSALPLRKILQSDADTTQVCQAVYDALLTNGASSRGVASVVSLAAADLLQRVDDSDYTTFVQVAHGLLVASATHLAFSQVQDIDVVPMVFTAAAYVHALHQELHAAETTTTPKASLHTAGAGGGLLAPAILDTLYDQLENQDIEGAFVTCHRYLQLGHEVKPLFATIGLVAAQADAVADKGHTLQIVQAAGEQFMDWPTDLKDTQIEGFLRVALRATCLAPRNALVSDQG